MNVRITSLCFATVLCFASTALADGAPAPSSSAEPAPPAPPTPQARLAGSYVFVGGQAEIDARDAAINKATESMFFAIKGLARSKLREKCPIRNSTTISFANGNVTVTEAGAPPATSPENGTPKPYDGGDGEPRTVTHKLTPDGKLAQRVGGENGYRNAVYSVASDNKTLTVEIRIDSPRIPSSISYTLTYRRN